MKVQNEVEKRNIGEKMKEIQEEPEDEEESVCSSDDIEDDIDRLLDFSYWLPPK
jgi:hypothetical protein